MNKKLSDCLKNYGLEIERNNAYGLIHNYETNVILKSLDNVAPVKIHISCFTTDEQKRNIRKALLEKKIKHANYVFTPYGLLVGLNDFTLSKLVNRLPNIIDDIYNTLLENQALDKEYCPVCGDELSLEKKTCNIDGIKITIDLNCIQQINDLIKDENEDYKEAPNNYLKGFAGALVGGLAGSVIALALSFIGFISSISAFVSAGLGSFLYKKFGGKPNKVMIFIVTITTLVLMILSVFLVYVMSAGIAASNQGLTISAFEAFNICMNDQAFFRLFLIDIFLTVVFSILGVSYQVYLMFKSTKRQSTI